MKIKVIISIMIVFIIMFSSVAVFADIPIPAIPSDAWGYWVVVSRILNGQTRYNLYSSHNPITASRDGDLLYIDPCRVYRLSEGRWVFDYDAVAVSSPIAQIYSSNHNIAYRNAPGFFFTVPSQSELYRTMKRVDSGILLTNISAGLIPLVGCLVLATCFKKGWDFLRSQLMR